MNLKKQGSDNSRLDPIFAVIKLEAGGIINPRMDTLMKLSDALGVSIDKLVGRMREK